MVLWLSLLAFMLGLGRSLIDWGVVYPEMDPSPDAATLLPRLMIYAALFGLWAWALVAIAQGRNRGLWVALVVTLLANLALGLATTLVLCPSPCQTLWPVAEIWNWATTLTGLAAVIAQVRALRSNAMA